MYWKKKNIKNYTIQHPDPFKLYIALQMCSPQSLPYNIPKAQLDWEVI